MNNLFQKIKNNRLIERITYWGMIVFLFLYTFSIPSLSGRGKVFYISYFLMAAFSVLTILYTFLFSKFKFNKWLIFPVMFSIFAFFGTAFYSHSFRVWLTLILMLFTLIFFYYSFVAINDNRLSLKVITLAFLAFGLYFVIVYREPIFHLRFSDSRLGAYFDNVNTIGFYFAIAFTLSLYIGLFHKKKIDLIFLAFSFIFLILGFFTGSRAFLVATLAGIVAIAFFRLRRHLFFFFIFLLILIGLCVALINIPQLAFLKDQFERTFYTIFGIGQSKIDTSTVQRIIWPRYGYYLAGKNMLFGYGCNGFSIYSGIGTYAHNNFAEVMCNFGLIGFFLFFSCYFLPVILAFRKKEQDELQLVPILFIIYFFRNFFGVTYYSKEAYLVLALLFYLTKDCKLPLIGSKNCNSLVDYEISI